MKKTKKNNKGFSLVELIVVVLIMAIIAVALAPQVMKWVGNSKVGTDISNYDSLVANIQLAMTEDTEITTATVTITGTETTITGTHAEKLAKALNKISGYAFAESTPYKSTSFKAKDTDNVGSGYVISVVNGSVQRTTTPDDSNIK